MDKQEIYCTVRGKVQGVFYRDFVGKHARHLALTGYVRNTSNFTVEVVAQGYQDKLENFIAHLRKGSFMARVSEVAVEWRKPTATYETFEIVF